MLNDKNEPLLLMEALGHRNCHMLNCNHLLLVKQMSLEFFFFFFVCVCSVFLETYHAHIWYKCGFVMAYSQDYLFGYKTKISSNEQ